MHPFNLTRGIFRTRLSRSGKVSPRPRLIALEVTRRCNARCRFCAFPSSPERGGEGELSRSEIEEIFRDPLSHRLDLLRITGGEPLLRADLPQMISGIFLRARPRLIYLTTNGTLPEALADLLTVVEKNRIRIFLQISVDGEGEIHDRVRGVPGAFAQVIRSLELIRQRRERFPFPAGINHTLTPENLEWRDRVISIAREYDLGYRMVVAARYNENTRIDLDPRQKEIPFAPAFSLPREELARVYRDVRAAAEQALPPFPSLSARIWGLGVKYLTAGEENRIFRGQSHPQPKCSAFFSHFRIRADGEMIPCSGLNQSGGNLKENSLSGIWNSSRARDLRQAVINCRGCWIECDILPSAVYSGDLIIWRIKGARSRR